jgi:RimJ/RimL family protein N-acetyltransferase
MNDGTLTNSKPLDAASRLSLAAALGDTPETVISVHLLRRGLCRALVAGSPDRPAAAIIQAHALPAEPTGFGDDPPLLWSLLRDLTGWTCVNVPQAAGPALAALIREATGRTCRLYEDVYHVVERPVAHWTDPAVRRLTTADLPRIKAAATALGISDLFFGSAAALLADGYAAGAIVDERLVAVAFTGARSDRHADIGVVTLEPWRGRGFSTAAAALVCAAVQADGPTPVWSTGEDNVASRRVAAKLGFGEVSRRVYVIPEREDPRP